MNFELTVHTRCGTEKLNGFITAEELMDVTDFVAGVGFKDPHVEFEFGGLASGPNITGVFGDILSVRLEVIR